MIVNVSVFAPAITESAPPPVIMLVVAAIPVTFRATEEPAASKFSNPVTESVVAPLDT